MTMMAFIKTFEVSVAMLYYATAFSHCVIINSACDGLTLAASMRGRTKNRSVPIERVMVQILDIADVVRQRCGVETPVET